MNDQPTPGPNMQRRVTHAHLLSPTICPAFLMKHIVTHAMDDVIHDGRTEPGDGYYWCSKTCNCIGPDDDYVQPKSCLPGRDCYDGPEL